VLPGSGALLSVHVSHESSRTHLRGSPSCASPPHLTAATAGARVRRIGMGTPAPQKITAVAAALAAARAFRLQLGDLRDFCLHVYLALLRGSLDDGLKAVVAVYHRDTD
jgi:hypothetical protein